MKKVRVLVIRAAGTNCNTETAFAFKYAGAIPEEFHINSIIKNPASFLVYHIIAIPGGFTYGDDVAPGKILANEIRFCLKEQIQKFVKNGKLVIGICNGFQVLVKAGLLPAIEEKSIQQATFTHNDSGKFEDRWVCLRPARTHCVWTKDINDIIMLPVAHGEGKYVPLNKDILSGHWKNKHIVFQYTDKNGEIQGYPSNPNGSVDSIAGVCDTTGRILGIMPHPERHIFSYNHPFWHRIKDLPKYGDGLKIFKNAVEYIKKHI